MAERWLPLPGYIGFYEVSDLGRVRSLYFNPPRPCRLGTDSNGYATVAVSKGKRRTTKTVHPLVAAAFHGHMRNILHNQVAHLDGDRKNARADNLKWVSKGENESHKKAHGTHQAGEQHPRARLTEANVIAIRHASVAYGVLAERYGVSSYTISDIKNGRRWRSVHEGAGRLRHRPNPVGSEQAK